MSNGDEWSWRDDMAVALRAEAEELEQASDPYSLMMVPYAKSLEKSLAGEKVTTGDWIEWYQEVVDRLRARAAEEGLA
jgi:hypothetical protein